MRFILFTILYSLLICINGQSNPYHVDSAYQNNVYWIRLQKIKTIIPLYFDEQIEMEIKLLLKDLSTPKNIGEYQFYKDTITSILGKNGLPKELSVIPFANTEFNPHYQSAEGESGIWALPYFVGKKYKLEINSFVDERHDIFKSTYAASQSLSDLYHIYRDWYFTIATFKCGPVIMNKAIRLAGNNINYFSAEPFLESANRTAFSKFMASIYVVNYYQLHNIKPEKFVAKALDTIQTPRTLDFNTLSNACKISSIEFAYLNAKFRKKLVPFEPVRYSFVIPASKKSNFQIYWQNVLKEEAQKKYNDSVLLAQKLIEKLTMDSVQYSAIVTRNGRLVALDSAGKEIDPDAPSNKTAEQSYKEDRWVYYTVKSGDVLYLLEDIFDVSLNDIKKWNGLRSNTITRGMRLKFLVPADKYAYYSEINRMSATQKQQVRRKD